MFEWRRALVTAILNLICFVLIVLFVLAYGQILNLNQVNNEPEPETN